MKITLDAVEFDSEGITPSKVADTLDNMAAFLNQVMGGIMLLKDGAAYEQKVGAVLNAAGQMKAAGDAWRGTSNIAQPQMRPVPVPTRQ